MPGNPYLQKPPTLREARLRLSTGRLTIHLRRETRSQCWFTTAVAVLPVT
ncbi:hypothetical protein [Chlorogloeopsis sp. ULAP02]